MNTLQTILRWSLRMVAQFDSRLSGRLAFWLFQIPGRKHIRMREKAFLTSVRKFSIDGPVGSIPCYELGPKSRELVVLVHGWRSNAGSMAAIAESLANRGYRVVGFDLPAHGAAGGHLANLRSCSLSLASVLSYFQYSGSLHVVSHSFGSAVAAYTLDKFQFQVKKLIMLSTPNRLSDIFEAFATSMGLTRQAKAAMLRKATELLGQHVNNVNVDELIAGLPSTEVHVIHDRFDQILPYQNALQVIQRAREANLITVFRVGHYRMLWKDSVLSQINLS